MAGLTFSQVSAVSSTNTVSLPSLTNGSFLLASVLAGPADGGVAPSNISDGTNTWIPLTTDFSGNALSFFYCAANSGTAGKTFTAVGATGTIRLWVGEWTGQNPTSPIAGVIPSGSIGSPSVGPILKTWTNLTSIVSVWVNPTSAAGTNFDGGAGAFALTGGSGGALLAYDNTLNGPGYYTASWTASPWASANGCLVLVKAATSTPAYYSYQDSRNYGNCPNLSRNVQGTLTYDVPSVFSLQWWFDTLFNRTQPQPVDSRAAGAPVDSRNGSAPLNSRTFPPF